jgi:twitching motility protein PilT
MASVRENEAAPSHAVAELNALIRAGTEHGASDIHLEPNLPVTFRIFSGLVASKKRMSREETEAIARALLSEDHWQAFLKKGSADLAKTIEGVRCRLNILGTSSGVGLAIRLLSPIVPTIETTNLHPSLKDLCKLANGLVLISGPTGSGKSTTLAALVEEINQASARHIITLEYPIEFEYQPHKSFIRQREIERDTPSMRQALVDSLRQDPDVLVVGEMREPETMRLTLNASETGHLVFATIHSGSCVEALERIVSAFPSEIQTSVAAQLADCLEVVVCQRLRFHKDRGIRIPECEILRSTSGVKSDIRRGTFPQITTALETGAESGMWTFDRYGKWVEARSDWYVPSRGPQGAAAEPSDARRL